jgi:hypothetical protein
MSHPHFFPYVIHLIKKNPRCPSESSTLAVSGADNELSLWDLALEDDEEADKAVKGHDSLKAIPPPILPLPTPPANPPYTPYALPPPCPPTLPPPYPLAPLPFPPPLRTCRRSSTLYTRDSKTSRRYTGTRSCRESSRVPPETRSTSSSPQITATDPCSSWEMWSRIPYV